MLVPWLFTNVPLDETIGLIAECVYGDSFKRIHPFPKTWFIKLLQFATSGIFSYNNKLYNQVDGVATGSPLGPSLANFFLSLNLMSAVHCLIPPTLNFGRHLFTTP